MFIMPTGGFISYCMGLTDRYDNVDVCIARPVMGFIQRSPELFGQVNFVVANAYNGGDSACYAKIAHLEVVEAEIGRLLTGVQVCFKMDFRI
jgi:hypothetical protein